MFSFEKKKKELSMEQIRRKEVCVNSSKTANNAGVDWRVYGRHSLEGGRVFGKEAIERVMEEMKDIQNDEEPA